MNWLHEWRMKRKIKRILKENRDHPEKTLDLSSHIKSTIYATGKVSYDDVQAAHKLLRGLVDE